jgi:hypothetical protein
MAIMGKLVSEECMVGRKIELPVLVIGERASMTKKKKKVMVFFRSRIYKKTKTDILEMKETMVLA